MKRIILVTTTLFLCFLAAATRVIATSDPVAVANNRLGVHILDPSEISAAAALVNNQSKGAWGYVTVPIQAADRDRVKWSQFFKSASELKIIPIIRVATVPNGMNWDEPNNYDLVDFANFLNDLPWPVKNRYVIIFNEVNHATEFGGFVSPEKYAQILANAIAIFKQRNADFFILPAGLDNAAPSNHTTLNWRTYLTRVYQERPDIFNQIDGWTSHAYPNPAFSGRPTDRNDHSVWSFQADLNFIRAFTDKKLPVFITETGWDMHKTPEDKAAAYFDQAWHTVWNNGQIAAITPFLLRAGDGPFTVFSLLRLDGSPTLPYLKLQSFALVGQPEPATATAVKLPGTSQTSAAAFWDKYQEIVGPIQRIWQVVFRWLFGGVTVPQKTSQITVGERAFTVEIADTDLTRQQGLSGREVLPANWGMLFIFDRPGYYAFWMPKMKFNLDIVWIDADKVVGVAEGFASSPYTLSTPPQQVSRVLEVTAGSGIKVGDIVELR